MILCDVNVLVYAFKKGGPEHDQYHRWLQGVVTSVEPYGVSDLVAQGNAIPDAYLAALAIESSSEWITADKGFARFPDLRWRHPLN